ncbi:hypothetical protein N0V94_009407 [Neodidymelliopsis sp. IMI 364377]|nr:hypothetical protein N0V94_009407 [Neodidymelliopsis sp. IMI 364377]
MADASGAPRRISMAYILGFSNKPFKDGGPPVPAQPPAPRHPSNFKRMVTTPGGIIEWTASDGRRGRLTGPGKPRLTEANLAQVPESKASVKAASKKDASEDDGGIGMMGLFDETPVASGGDAAKGEDKSSDWTEEQDKKLMEMKDDNKSWKDIVKEIGDKKENECKERFKTIKPSDWKPNAKNKGGGKQKQDGKDGGKEQKSDKAEDKQDDKKDDKKEEPAANVGFDAAADDTWGANNATGPNSGFQLADNVDAWRNTDTSGAAQGNNDAWPVDNTSWGKDETSGSKQEDSSKGWGESNSDNSAWKQEDASKGWGHDDNKSDGEKKDDVGFDPNSNLWATTWNGDSKTTGDENKQEPPRPTGSVRDSRKSSKAPSIKSASQHSSKHPSHHSSEKPTAQAPTEYELRPDSTFSADDLRLIARILQQDSQMVWDRVSWRFRDKTGRNLQPEVFEKKITGKVAESQSERNRKR